MKGSETHANDGLLLEGEQWGYVDAEGNVHQRDGIIFRGRVIGKMRGHNKEATLGFFVLRFKELDERFESLEREARSAEHKGTYIGKVRHMLGYLPDFDGLGDFDGLKHRLERLESDLVQEVERIRNSKVSAKNDLIRRAESLSGSSDWKSAAEELKSLQGSWKKIGGTGNEEEGLWQRFRTACDRFFERRTAHFEEMDRQRRHNADRKADMCSEAESFRHSPDLKAATERVKELQGEWKGVGHAPSDMDDALWGRFRRACDGVFAAAKEERERKQEEWRGRMEGVVAAKQEQIDRLRESVEHDRGLVSHWNEVISNLRDGNRADEIRDSMESKIASVEERIQSKEEKISKLEEDISDIKAKLRG